MDITYLLLQFLVHIKYSLYRADDVGCTLHNIGELKQGLVQLMSGVAVFVLVCGQRVDTLNKCCDIY